MDPEDLDMRQRLRNIWNSFLSLLWSLTAPIRGTSVAGAWLRLVLMVVGMIAAYAGMRALIGELPDLVSEFGRFLENFGELMADFFELFLPAAEPAPALRDLPKAPRVPWLVQLQNLFRQLSQDDVQDLLVFGLIPLIWALGRALDVFEDTFRLNSFRAVTENLLAAYIPLFRRNMAIREASLVMDVTTIHPRRVGGPLRLAVDAGSLALLEPVRNEPRLVTNTGGRVEVNAFERLHRILDLGEHTLELDQVLQTRDGIQVTLTDAHFGYRIRQVENGVDEAAAFRLVYSHWLGKSWENPTARERDMLRLVQRELAQFISDQKDLSDLLPNAAPSETQPANLLGWKVLQEFVDTFNSREEHGLQLTWQGGGEWQLLEALFHPSNHATLETCLEDQSRRLSLAQMVPGEARKIIIREMANQVLEKAAALDETGADPETKIAQLLEVYNNLLEIEPA